MEKKILGRTGLEVTVMGIGYGGPSRVGQRTGRSEHQSVSVIRRALDAGINFIDTAEAYHTETIVGKAIKGLDRSQLVLSTKKSLGEHITGQDVVRSLESSLRQLGTDYIDIYHLHGVQLKNYAYLAADIVPVLQRMRDQGKLRFIALSELFGPDPQHAMLQRALQDDVWDVMMVGFNVLNQSARDRVFAATIEKNIGILIMFAVRRALSQPERLVQVIGELIQNGQVDPGDIDRDNPLGFLIHEEGALSVPDAAYRFCRDEPGTHVILSGTGNLEHMEANIASFNRPPLPEPDRQRLMHIFRNVDAVSGG
ncbi:MAG: aldo/keto reductase [Anaerolineae bacterium]|nr:aldo/keto reductase [Anaerolineae bacterium]